MLRFAPNASGAGRYIPSRLAQLLPPPGAPGGRRRGASRGVDGAGKRAAMRRLVDAGSGSLTRMGVLEFESDRRFQVWKYNVGHGLLLLRSVKDEEHPSRIDVLFVGTNHIDLPMTFDGLRIEQDGTAFRLSGTGWAGAVSALDMAHAEDEGEYHDPSPFAESSGI